jgi:dolichol-phosphate mannosyltransferase
MIGAQNDPLISVVVPAYNEAGVLERLCDEVFKALRGHRFEIVFVNDGSTDGSTAELDRLAVAREEVKVVHLSRNFGHQAAIVAGLEHALGDAVILMDCDLQDDPAALPKMVEKWKEGYEVVYATRYGRKENFVKRFLFYVFYRFLNAISNTPMPNDAGNFGLVDGRVARLLRGTVERDRYYAGLRRWMGFRQVGIEVERGERYDGTPRVSGGGLFRLAKSAIFSFSAVPLTIFYAIAALSAAAFLYLFSFTLYHKLVTGLAIPGWTSTIMTACFFGALNALGIGILGEYVLRIYDQVRGRPLYVVDRTVNLDAAAGDSESAGRGKGEVPGSTPPP